jgi:hypothetical protein
MLGQRCQNGQRGVLLQQSAEQGFEFLGTGVQLPGVSGWGHG